MALSALNQAVASGTHFLLNALLVRQLSPEGFGAYGVAFSMLPLALNVGDAVFMTPMTLRIAQASAENARTYAATIFAGSLFVSGLVALAVGGVAAVLFRSSGADHLLALSAMVCLTALFYLAKETLVRICYAMKREGGVLVLNGSFAAAVLGLCAAPTFGAKSATAAVAFYGASACLASLIGLTALNLFAGARITNPADEMRALFREGRWYLGSNLAYWLRLQAPILVATWTSGLALVGVLNASRLLVTPPVLLNPAAGQVALPRLAQLAGSDPRGVRFKRGVLLFGGLLLGTSAAYCGILWVFFDRAMLVMLGRGLTVPWSVVGAWCAFVMLQAVRNGAEVSLKARRAARHALAANAVSAAVAFPLCLAIGAWLGGPGLVLGAAVAEATVTALMVFPLQRARSRLVEWFSLPGGA